MRLTKKMPDIRIGIDPLTGVMNQKVGCAHLDLQLNTAKTNNARVAVLYIDFDNFKHFNAHNGFDKGDSILSCYPLLIAPILKPQYEIFRIGGDEFIIIIPNATDGVPEAIAREICDISRNKLTPPQPVHCGDPHCLGPATLSASIGIALSLPSDDVSSLVQRAKDKLNEAKLSGRACFRI